MKTILSVIITIAVFHNISAQNFSEIFTPKEYKKAFSNNTRTYSGKPGVDYFQNKSDYQILAEFIPELRTIKGHAIIQYSNNSPDTLKAIHFHIFQDLFKKGNKLDWDMGAIDLHDGVEISKIRIGEQEYFVGDSEVSRRNSLLNIRLKKNINPRTTCEIEIDWSFVIAEHTPVRMGKYGEDNFLVAYWYPKIVVYDDIIGWNTTGYSGMAEFYHDFGNYDVQLTIPSDFQVWATAGLQNPKDNYTDLIISRIEQAKMSDSVIHIITEKDRENNIITKTQHTKNTWKFKASNMPDFAFAVSQTYLWDGVRANNRTTNGVFVSAVYKSNSPDFPTVCKISKNAVEYFSSISPGISYPYSQLTAFNGNGGMEFPGMINDGDMENENATLYVTAHEIGHSYFPFMTGLNEQKYAWMDEGLISFIPRKFENQYSSTSNHNAFKSLIASYNSTAGTLHDIPPGFATEFIGNYTAYRFHAYTRSGTTFYLLDEYLGSEKFNNALQLFAKRWESKHPIPHDLFACFDEVANENLSWFWQKWIYTNGYADLSLDVYKEKFLKNGEVKISKLGELPVPIRLFAENQDGTIEIYTEQLSIWKDKNEMILHVKNPKNIKSLQLDYTLTPDAFPENNFVKF